MPVTSQADRRRAPYRLLGELAVLAGVVALGLAVSTVIAAAVGVGALALMVGFRVVDDRLRRAKDGSVRLAPGSRTPHPICVLRDMYAGQKRVVPTRMGHQEAWHHLVTTSAPLPPRQEAGVGPVSTSRPRDGSGRCSVLR